MSEDFELWLARERARQAEASHKDINEIVNRTKTRASSLLGWCITLTSASVAAASQTENHKIEAAAAACGFFAAAMACVRTLYSSPYNPVALSPDMFSDMLDQYPSTSEREVLEAYAEFAGDVINENGKSAEYDQKWLRRAWWIAALTPVAAAASFLFARLIRWLGVA